MLTRHLLALAAICLAAPAVSQPGVTYSVTPQCRVLVPQAGTKQKKGQIIACPPLDIEAAPPAAPALRIGMNLTGIANYSAELPFIDRFRAAGSWIVKGGPYAYVPAPAALLDANGWPAASGGPGVEFVANVPLDATSATYALTYSGTGSFFINGAADVSRDPGRLVFKAAGVINVNIGTTDAAPIHDIHVVRLDQEAAFKAGQDFNPDFLDAIAKRFSPLRTMDWSCTNGSQLAHWADRPKVTDENWSCVPIEVQVALANAAGSDLWLNIPALADDDYIRQAVTMVRDTLAPGLKLHLEYSNEVWNDNFDQSKWAQAQGVALFGAVGWERQRWYGYRAAQMMRIAKDVLGARVVGVYAVFTAYTDPALDAAIDAGIARANVGTTADLFGEYAVTTYFGDQLSLAPTPESDANRPTIIRWAAANDLDAAFNEIEHGGGLKGDASLDHQRGLYSFHAPQAKARGLKLVAYEGGFSGYWFNTTPAEQAIVLPFLQRLVADPRMGVLYQRMATDFAAAGGVELTNFNDVGGVSIWGPWGAVPDLKSTSPRYEALRAMSGR